MKHTFLKSISILSILVLSAFTTKETKEVNIAESVVNWVGHKVTGQHEGTITLQQGALEFSNNRIDRWKFCDGHDDYQHNRS